MSELKPCPFCGKIAKYDIPIYKQDGRGWYSTYCANCGASGPSKMLCERADEMWNLRRPEDALRARIAELEAASRWIPVEERLPESFGCYLTLAEDWIEQDYFTPEGRWLSGSNITHWQPLPPPPEVQS